MGSYIGFIVMCATLASQDVDCYLIPESPFYMHGEGGLIQYIERRLKENKHMVIVVAEGAGHDLIAHSIASLEHQDTTGNKLHFSVGSMQASESSNLKVDCQATPLEKCCWCG
jgi:6-phosphofructokinase 1